VVATGLYWSWDAYMLYMQIADISHIEAQKAVGKSLLGLLMIASSLSVILMLHLVSIVLNKQDQ
jgi:hypothetical protein